jgi:hypothetical protein
MLPLSLVRLCLHSTGRRTGHPVGCDASLGRSGQTQSMRLTRPAINRPDVTLVLGMRCGCSCTLAAPAPFSLADGAIRNHRFGTSLRDRRCRRSCRSRSFETVRNRPRFLALAAPAV